MKSIDRLRQYLAKASFSNASDKFSAVECLAELEREIASVPILMDALKKIERHIGPHTFVSDLQHIAHTAIIKATGK